MKAGKPYRIILAEPFSPEAVKSLEAVGDVRVLADSSPESLMAALAEADALLVRTRAHVTARIIDAAPRLKVIGRASGNADHIDLRAAKRRNIPVVYAPHLAVRSTAEFALALILTLHRRIPFFDEELRRGQFESLRTPSGHELGRETIGLVGLDPIAEQLGRMCATAFGSKIIYYDLAGRTPTEFSGLAVELDALLAEADVLSVHLPLSAATRHLLNAARLTKLKPTAILVNTSRGAIIDGAALAVALKKRQLAAAALDVFEIEPLPADHPLRRTPNCLLTPHVAGATLDASTDRFKVTEDVVRVLRGEAPLYAAEVPPDA